ncbi:hypothetical protein IFR04_006925 [Cadophora malorum]|uniref:Uncharacterized protein n=1 Tax=Cadophora malorum TaxID=108018 RepID=A0A8H7TJF2_9HELO|nr:hypothetical protein IFR04_006925 [Cadophora malorum]
MADPSGIRPITCTFETEGLLQWCTCREGEATPLHVDGHHCFHKKGVDRAEFDRLQVEEYESQLDPVGRILLDQYRRESLERYRQEASMMSRWAFERFLRRKELEDRDLLELNHRLGRAEMDASRREAADSVMDDCHRAHITRKETVPDEGRKDGGANLARQTETVRSSISGPRSWEGSKFLEGLERTLEDLGGRQGAAHKTASPESFNYDPKKRQWEDTAPTQGHDGYKNHRNIFHQGCKDMVAQNNDEPTPVSLSVEMPPPTFASIKNKAHPVVNVPHTYGATGHIEATSKPKTCISSATTSNRLCAYHPRVFYSTTKPPAVQASTAVTGQSVPRSTATIVEKQNSKLKKTELRKRDILDQHDTIEINPSEASKTTSIVQQAAIPSISPTTLLFQTEAKPELRGRRWDDDYWDWLDRVTKDRKQYLFEEKRNFREAYQLQLPGGRTLRQKRLRYDTPFRWVLERKRTSKAMPEKVHCRLDDITEAPGSPNSLCDPPIHSNYPQVSAGSIITPSYSICAILIFCMFFFLFVLQLFPIQHQTENIGLPSGLVYRDNNVHSGDLGEDDNVNGENEENGDGLATPGGSDKDENEENEENGDDSPPSDDDNDPDGGARVHVKSGFLGYNWQSIGRHFRCPSE